MDAGLLVLRLVVGLLIAGHGVQKVSFRLGGNGLAGGTEEFRRDGFRGGRPTALVAGGSQIGAGLFLTVGLLTPPAAMAAMGVMTVAGITCGIRPVTFVPSCSSCWSLFGLFVINWIEPTFKLASMCAATA
jgi:uncharacterized membrane protein YphA (DoxX/SURF4 family)